MVLRKKIFLLLSLLVLSSCRAFDSGLSVLLGNYAYQQGDNQKALLHYLKEVEREGLNQDRISYNIATVYYALGEGEAALKLWKKAMGGGDREVMFAAQFNSGIVLFEAGRYEEAHNAFKGALTLNPSSVLAKRNLELTVSRMEAEPQGGEGVRSPSTQELTDSTQRIIQYIRHKGGNVWSPSESSDTIEKDW